MMDSEYVEESLRNRIFPWTLLPPSVYRFFTRIFGGHNISEEGY
jgi:hypothetical protein